MASTIPVVICTTNTASVALPSVCHQVRPAGIFLSSSVSRMEARSSRLSSHRPIALIALCLNLLSDSQSEIPVFHEHRAVAHLNFQLIEWPWWRPRKHASRRYVELPVMARAEKILVLLVVDVGAAEVRAVPIVGLELLAVLGEQRYTVERSALQPCIHRTLNEIHASRNSDIEQRDVVCHLHPIVRGRSGEHWRYK